MGEIHELYETRVRTMAPEQRLQLAKLIIDGLYDPEKPLDVSDGWSDDDLADLVRFSVCPQGSADEDVRRGS